MNYLENFVMFEIFNEYCKLTAYYGFWQKKVDPYEFSHVVHLIDYQT
jgi:hypothetical protein